MIEFHCGCGQKIAVPDQMAGKKGKCPGCSQVLDVPHAGAAAQPEAVADFGPVAPPTRPESGGQTAEAGHRDCPFCGESIKAAAKKCRFCGEFLDQSARVRPAAARSHSAGSSALRRADEAANLSLVFALLSLFICPILFIGAIAKGNEARNLARSAGIGTPGAATAGLVIGWIYAGLALVFTAIFVFAMLLAAGHP